VAFDLGQAPLFRACCCGWRREHVFGLTLHHILCDEWSLGVFMEELRSCMRKLKEEKSQRCRNWQCNMGRMLSNKEKRCAREVPAQMNIGKAQLAEMPQALELPNRPCRPVGGRASAEEYNIKVWKATCWRA